MARLPGLGAFRDWLRGAAVRPVTDEDASGFLVGWILAEPLLDVFFRGSPAWTGNVCQGALRAALEPFDGASVQDAYAPWLRARHLDCPAGGGYAERLGWLNDSVSALFRRAFVRDAQVLGVVFTPLEVVDFIIRSKAEAIRREFGRELWEPGVRILDPFCGTGTFLARTIDLGLLDPNLEYKYRRELRGNEFVPLFWHVARLNLETEYWRRTGDYVPCEGVRLVDTFAEWETEGE
ncbi:MAG: hypothetical protein LBW85_01300 [Deltaproteobacteria bacterium]|nr:hypothetical protein [Deltaproteobacteria bacterium]